MAVPEILERRVGPFPVVAWVGLIGAGVGIGIVLRKHNAGKAPKSSPAPATSPGGISPITSGAPNPYASGGVAAPSASGAGGASPSPTTDTAQFTNLDWSKKAITWLIAQGVNPSDAQGGITKFLEGRDLTQPELAAVQRALRESTIGLPPEYVPPISGTAAPFAPPAQTNPSQPVLQTPPTLTRMMVMADDGDVAVFISDGRTKEWIRDGNSARALARSGIAVAGWHDNGDPIPFRLPRSTINALAPVGPAPNYGGQGGPQTPWS